jgi:uncharacterized protein (TIGR02001 family)
MKKLILAAAVLGAYSMSVQAQTAESTPTPEHSFTGNVAVVTDYRFRGISQTYKQPAVQGGFDYAHSSGFYVGNWNSNVSGNSYNNGAGLEMDFYGGYKFAPVQDLNLDIGLLYYYYPGAEVGNTGVKYNNGEIYIGGTYKWFSAKYNYGLTDFFGLRSQTAPGITGPRGDSKGSGYLDLAATFDVYEKTTLTLHVGRQWVRNYGALNYTDYKIGVARDFGFATLGLAVIGTNADRSLYTVSNTSGTGSREVGTTTAVLSLSKTF